MNHKVLGAFAAAIVVMSSSASADSGIAPTLNITSPTAGGGPLFFGSFPAQGTISYAVTMNGGSQLKDLTNLNVTVNGVSLYGGPQDAFANGAPLINQCQGIAATAPNTCNSVDAYNASLTARWNIPAVGQYTIVVTGKYRSEVGEDMEIVQVSQLSAEYPAPPAVANAYINSKPRNWITSTQRGCIIKYIAEQHGQYSYFGPKGGPYDVALIQGMVDSTASSCPR